MATLSDIRVVQVFRTGKAVKLKWGEGGAKQATILSPDTTQYFDAPCSFSASDSNGYEPFIKTFGSLLHCNGGILSIGQTCYRIHVQEQHAAAAPFEDLPLVDVKWLGVV